MKTHHQIIRGLALLAPAIPCRAGAAGRLEVKRRRARRRANSMAGWLGLLFLWIFNLQLSEAVAQLTFTTNTYSAGYGSISVVAADVNGDSKVDLISANYDASTLTVLTNNGSGAFGFNATLNVGSQPRCVVAADILAL